MRKKSKKVVERKPVFISDEIACARKNVSGFLGKVKEAERVLERNRVVLECIKELTKGFKLFVLNSYGNSLLVVIGCKVQSMKDIEPVLALIEKHFKVTFDGNNDHADFGWRSFTTKQLRWLRVDAEVDDGSQQCRKVIVGYEQTPKYELQCDEPVAV